MSQQIDAMLVVEKGVADDISVIPLDQQLSLLGKAPAANIVVDNPYVSRRHAQIARDKQGFVITDMGSKNGTYINGAALEGEGKRLRSGDRIELGRNQVVLRFQEWGTTVTLPPVNHGTQSRLVVDARSREVWIGGTKVEPPFSRKEFDMLNLLFQRKGEACSKDELAVSGWPERPQGDVADQDIEQYIRRLRLRIEPNPSIPRYIQTIRGYGYKLTLG